MTNDEYPIVEVLATLPMWALESMRDILTDLNLAASVRCLVIRETLKVAINQKTEAEE